MSLKKSHKSYPQAFKGEAVLMVLEQGYSVADAVKSLGVSTSLLYNWKEKHEALKQGVTLEESERDDLKRLRKENKELRMEKEILKKAGVDSIVQRNSYVKACRYGGLLNEANIYSKGKSVCF